MATEPSILTIERLHAHYGLSHVLQGVDIDFPAGGVTAIVGANGVGKTTLINTIMGLIPVTSGRIIVDGSDVTHRPATERRSLGMGLVPQGRRVFRSLTVDEHLNLIAPGVHGAFNQDWIYRTFPRLLERRQSAAGTLSGGEQSMLVIARALTTNPRLLLMDEPTEGLAPLLVEIVESVIAQLRGLGITIIVVEQKLGFALAVADRIAVMHRGTISRVQPRATVASVEHLRALVMGETA